MTSHQRRHGEQQRETNRMPSASKWAMVGFLVIAGYFLITEHRAHVVQFLPFLLILACPLLHIMHGGHGAHGDQTKSKQGWEGGDEDSGQVNTRIKEKEPQHEP